MPEALSHHNKNFSDFVLESFPGIVPVSPAFQIIPNNTPDMVEFRSAPFNRRFIALGHDEIINRHKELQNSGVPTLNLASYKDYFLLDVPPGTVSASSMLQSLTRNPQLARGVFREIAKTTQEISRITAHLEPNPDDNWPLLRQFALFDDPNVESGIQVAALPPYSFHGITAETAMNKIKKEIASSKVFLGKDQQLPLALEVVDEEFSRAS